MLPSSSISSIRLMKASEDLMFAQVFQQFSRDDQSILEEIIPRLKNASEHRAMEEIAAPSPNTWNYDEEAKAWDLLSRLSRAQTDSWCEDIDEKCNDGRKRIIGPEHALHQESDLQIALRLIRSKKDLRWLRAVLDWLELNVDRKRLDQVYMWRTDHMWKRTLEREAGEAVHLDPDFEGREGGSLEEIDQEEEQHLLYGLWLLCRTGRLGWVARVRDFDPQNSAEAMRWAEEKARHALLNEDPHREPTPDQLQQKIEQLEDPLWGYLNSLEEDPEVYGNAELGPVERLCKIWGQPWRAVTVSGGDLSHDPVLAGYNIGADLQPREELEEQGNSSHRMLWRSMCLALAGQAVGDKKATGASNAIVPSQSHYEQRHHHKDHAAAAYESALYGMLGGQPSFAMPVCLNWEDELWSLAKTKFDAELECAIAQEKERKGLLPASHNELINDRAVAQAQAASLRKSLTELAEIPDTSGSAQNLANAPLALLERCLIRGELNDVLIILETWGREHSMNEQRWVCSLRRFGVHLVLLLRGKTMAQHGPSLPSWPVDQQEDIDQNTSHMLVQLCDSLLAQYAQYLQLSAQAELAAQYIVLLSNKNLIAEGLEQLFQHLPDEEGLKLQEDHLEWALTAMERRDVWSLEDVDVGPREMVIHVARCVSAPHANFFSLDGPAGDLRPSAYAVRIKWLCVFEETSLDAVRTANFWIREMISKPNPQYRDALKVISYLPERIRSMAADSVECEHCMELLFWWEFLSAEEDFQFVQGYYSQLQQAERNAGSEVVKNVIMEGFTLSDVVVRGKSSVQHFVSCLKLLPDLNSGGACLKKPATSQIVQPALRSMYWLLTTLLPKLLPMEQASFLEESLQLSVLIMGNDKSGRHKIFEHLDQPQIQEFVKLMAISQTELFKYQDQISPMTWEHGARTL